MEYKGAPDLNLYIQGKYELIVNNLRQDNILFIAPQLIHPIINALVPVEVSLNYPQQYPIHPLQSEQRNTVPQNISCWKYCCQILFYLIISFFRFAFTFAMGIFPSGILWIIADLLFITATFFICCSQLLKKYRIFIIFCITSFILDLAGLIYSSVYLRISTANGCLSTTVTSSDSNISTTGYMYEIDYTNSFSKEIEICDNEIDYRVWLIVFSVMSVVMYLFLLSLFYCTSKWKNSQTQIQHTGQQIVEESNLSIIQGINNSFTNNTLLNTNK